MRSIWISCWLGLLACLPAHAQTLPVSSGDQWVAFDSGEAWAMRYVGAASLMTGFGATPTLAAGEWALSGEVGHIPHLSREQQQVGLGGIKSEDLNKSPVFGRLRGWVGLPWGWVAELGYTPPLQIDGTQPVDLFAAALSRRWDFNDDWSLSGRVLGQHGAARGDITCPAGIIGAGAAGNPFACARPSRDRIALNYYGLETTLARRFASTAAHLSVGTLRYEPRVRIDAELRTYIERIRLLSDGQIPYVATGINRPLRSGWQLGAEVLYVPLEVRRSAESGRENDAFWSLRLRLQWQPGAASP